MKREPTPTELKLCGAIAQLDKAKEILGEVECNIDMIENDRHALVTIVKSDGETIMDLTQKNLRITRKYRKLAAICRRVSYAHEYADSYALALEMAKLDELLEEI